MDLRLALLILGAIVVVAVFTLSRYSHVLDPYLDKVHGLIKRNRKNRRTQPKRDKRRDPLLDQSGDENEPVQEELFDFGSEPAETSDLDGENQLLSESQADYGSATTDTETAEVADEEEDTFSTLEGEHHELRKATGPFTSLRQIDYWIKLSLLKPLPQGEVLANLQHWDQIAFPVQLHALTAEEPHWIDLSEAQNDTAITDVVASYQLLFGGNPTDINDLRAFDQQVSQLGKSIDAEKLMMASPEQALDQSQKLAQFFSESCEPLEVSICAPRGQTFMGKLVETSAKQQGLDFMAGEYVRQKRMASHNVILYRMINTETGHFEENMSADANISCVTFTMMPALSQTPGRDAKEMLDAVKAFASRVKGEIRIPGEKEFHQDLLLKLRNRVSKLERDTLAAGLEPGGLEICRIFS